MRDLRDKARNIANAASALDGADLEDVALAIVEEAYRKGRQDERRANRRQQDGESRWLPGPVITEGSRP